MASMERTAIYCHVHTGNVTSYDQTWWDHHWCSCGHHFASVWTIFVQWAANLKNLPTLTSTLTEFFTLSGVGSTVWCWPEHRNFHSCLIFSSYFNDVSCPLCLLSSDSQSSLNLQYPRPEHHFFAICYLNYLQCFYWQFSQSLTKFYVSQFLKAIHFPKSKSSMHRTLLWVLLHALV